MDLDDALPRAIANAEAAEQLLAVDRALSGRTPGGYAKDAEEGPYGVFEDQRSARYAGATAYAGIAQAWAAIAPPPPTSDATQVSTEQARRPPS